VQQQGYNAERKNTPAGGRAERVMDDPCRQCEERHGGGSTQD
jgi:hypothetical protein